MLCFSVNFGQNGKNKTAPKKDIIPKTLSYIETSAINWLVEKLKIKSVESWLSAAIESCITKNAAPENNNGFISFVEKDLVFGSSSGNLIPKQIREIHELTISEVIGNNMQKVYSLESNINRSKWLNKKISIKKRVFSALVDNGNMNEYWWAVKIDKESLKL